MPSNGRRIRFQVLHAILQFPVLFIQPLDFLLYFLRLQLRAAHRENSVRAENILQQEQPKSRDQKPIQVAAKKFAHLIAEACLGRGRFLRRSSLPRRLLAG